MIDLARKASAIDDWYSGYIHLSRYARWDEKARRRETWPETVERYVSFFKERSQHFPADTIRDAILEKAVMPSMRCLMTAGPALARDNVAGYNCSFTAADHPRAFDEIMHTLMCGVGVGFSVERQFVNRLPTISESMHSVDSVIKVPDSRVGWAASYRQLIALLYSGQVPKWDLSAVRPAGAKLKTFGGRASGPEPLNKLLHFTVDLFSKALDRKLTSVECHDLICKIAEIVVVGGVRRSALISLSNLSDDRMRHAKTGQWWVSNGQRALANNSAVYTERPDMEIFIKEWAALIESKSGERGIFNRECVTKKAESNGRRKTDGVIFGTNPCGEIYLRPNGLCNLSESVVREDDNLRTLMEKVEIATIIGTFQSTLTDFRYVRPIWKRNAEEERLLGVSLTGIMDNANLVDDILGGSREVLPALKQHAIETNKKWAEILGINQSAAVTCVKPSGTVSELVNTSSGIHPRFAPFYARTVRGDNKDPITEMLIAQGVPHETDKTNSSVTVFSFPRRSPKLSITRNGITAVGQLNLYMAVRDQWCEHNPSTTIYVRPDEWLEVAAAVYKNWDGIGGVAFLPSEDHVYEQAPFTEITEAEYVSQVQEFPGLDLHSLPDFEKEDHTTGAQELACVAGVCSV